MAQCLISVSPSMLSIVRTFNNYLLKERGKKEESKEDGKEPRPGRRLTNATVRNGLNGDVLLGRWHQNSCSFLSIVAAPSVPALRVSGPGSVRPPFRTGFLPWLLQTASETSDPVFTLCLPGHHFHRRPMTLDPIILIKEFIAFVSPGNF